MCGICGDIDFLRDNVEPRRIKGMCHELRHRGPDDEGMVFIRDGRSIEVGREDVLPEKMEPFQVGLGHRRLSIIDLSQAAHQPMGNEDRTVWIVFNGEIYNFKNLRKDLEKRGHRFRSQSDTEVVLHGYEEWGAECLNRFRGMFAFAIWDGRRKRMFLARDRLGKKPLVYSWKDGRLIFASEIKAILKVPGVDRSIDEDALNAYLTYQYVPAPRTIYKGIRKLPPGHYLMCEGGGGVKVERYWRLQFGEAAKGHRDVSGWSHVLREELEESVKLRLISDVPLGAFLSGGMDSSVIVGLMAKHMSQPVKTFSIGFQDEAYDELSHARVVSRHFGTEHHEFVVRPNALDILPKLVWHYNEPFADSSAIPTYYVAKMTRGHVTVVLTGDGGDESFAGYPRYRWARWATLLTRFPEAVRRQWMPDLIRSLAGFHWREPWLNRGADVLAALSPSEEKNYFELISVFRARDREAIYTMDFAQRLEAEDPQSFMEEKFREMGPDGGLERLLYVDLHTYLPEDLLVKMDIASMANSLEARAPFLDHVFVERAAQIPFQLKMKGHERKFILKKAFSDLLPPSILHRKKMGFAVPVARWFRKDLREFVSTVLLETRTLNRGYFRKEGIERLLNEHTALRYDHSAKLWALLVLEFWFRIFVDEEEDLVFRAA